MRDLIVIVAIVAVALIGARAQKSSTQSAGIETTGGYYDDTETTDEVASSPIVEGSKPVVGETMPTGHESVMPGSTESLIVTTQTAGDAVVVDSATLATPTWIAVHDAKGTALGNVLGAAWFPAGTHKKVTVELLRNTIPAGAYFVALYADNGNKKFEYRTDAPVADSLGNPIIVRFSVAAQ